MDNLLLEVDEAMRWERIEKFWKTYGNYVIAFVALTILFTAVEQGYKAWNDSVKTAGAEKLLNLVQDKDYPANVKTANLSGMRSSVKGVALIIAAGDLLKQGKTADAVEMYGRAAKNSSIKPEIRGLAILMTARLAANDPNSKTNIIETLKPVLDDAKSPWRPYALLEAAAICADRDHDFAKAHGYLQQIANDQTLQQSIRNKARALDQLYALKLKTADDKQGAKP